MDNADIHIKEPVITASEEGISKAAAALREGMVVAFPTETVYGLGADATNGKAVSQIFEIKQRPAFNPLIVHIAAMEMLETLVELRPAARKIAASLWPGPLTMILERTKNCPVSELCSVGMPTLGVRMPAHPTARKLIAAAACPLAAPSANRSGRLSPTTPQHVLESFGADCPMVLADGACKIGLESTVVDLTAQTPVILRPGGVTDTEIAHVLDCGVEFGFENKSTETPRSPGLTLRHYAPDLPLRLNAVDIRPGEALLAFGSDKFMGIQGGGRAADLPDHAKRNLSTSQDLNEAAANLFRMLHELDRPKTGMTGIAVMPIPQHGVGVAINDRLRRAATAQTS